MALLKRQLSASDIKSSRRASIRYTPQQSLPAGAVTEFVWKDYCTDTFKNLLDIGGIDHDDYIRSVHQHETLMEVFLQGKSGKPFYLPIDARFVIKPLKKSQVKLLIELLPSYHSHVKAHGTSLLTKIYGLHAARSVAAGQKVYFVVMENLLKSDLRIHKRFDLKGSTQGRSLCKPTTHQRIVLKDVDFNICFYLEPTIRNQLLEQISVDCKFLEENGVMDYSLLLGVHMVPHGDSNQLRQQCGAGSKDATSIYGAPNNVLDPTTTYEEISSDDHSRPRHKRDPTLADFLEPMIRPPITRLGEKVPAIAVKIPRSEKGSTASSNKRVGEPGRRNVILYFGIIDFLQNYSVIKKIEHAYKSLHYDSKAIPSVPPKVYSTRFQEFFCRTFLAEDINDC